MKWISKNYVKIGKKKFKYRKQLSKIYVKIGKMFEKKYEKKSIDDDFLYLECISIVFILF